MEATFRRKLLKLFELKLTSKQLVIYYWAGHRGPLLECPENGSNLLVQPTQTR